MAELKTKQNDASVDKFLRGVADDHQRADAMRVLELMRDVTGLEPKMWGKSIVGFGSYHYQYDSGQSGDWFRTGFSPRKGNLTLYLMAGFARHADLLKKLGKYKTGKSCLYIKKLEDIDMAVLRELVRGSLGCLATVIEEQKERAATKKTRRKLNEPATPQLSSN